MKFKHWRTQFIRLRLAAVLTALLLATTFQLYGCTFNTQAKPQTPVDVYYTALDVFTAALDSYKTHYDAAPANLQATWRKDIDPVILKADAALDAWGMAVLSGEDIGAKEETYRKIKAELWQVLLDVGAIKKD